MKLVQRNTNKVILKGSIIYNNAGVKFQFQGFTAQGLLKLDDTDEEYHPASFSASYKVVND